MARSSVERGGDDGEGGGGTDGFHEGGSGSINSGGDGELHGFNISGEISSTSPVLFGAVGLNDINVFAGSWGLGGGALVVREVSERNLGSVAGDLVEFGILPVWGGWHGNALSVGGLDEGIESILESLDLGSISFLTGGASGVLESSNGDGTGGADLVLDQGGGDEGGDSPGSLFARIILSRANIFISLKIFSVFNPL